MHENAPTLQATKRERTGSRYARRLREQGSLPAVMYGHKQEPVALTLDAREAIGHITAGERVFTVQCDGADPQLVLLKSIQFDYLGTNIVHADLTRVDLNERVRTRIPIQCIGDAKGLNTPGSLLMYPNTEIEVECMLSSMVSSLEVDISTLEAGGAITAGEVGLPEGTTLLSDPNAVVVRIAVKSKAMQAAEDAEGEEAQVDGAAQPEVLTEKKDEESES